MVRASAAQQMANRQRIMAAVLEVPRPSNRAIAERLDINESTVRSVLLRWGSTIGQGIEPLDKKRSGRPIVYDERWKRCFFCSNKDLKKTFV